MTSALQTEIDIRPGAHFWRPDFGEIWRYRGLLYFLVWREVKIRYKQAAIGAAWAILQPVVAAAIFAVVFGLFARMPSGKTPYLVFAFTAVLPWTYFAEAVRRASTGLVADSELIQKIYFPRVLLPVAMVIAPLVDFAAGLVVLAVLLAWFGITPGPLVFLLPVFLLLAAALALSVALWLGPLGVRYRDVTHALPFLIQVWLYASPVVYPSSLAPDRWKFFYDLNPMVGVIEGFRWIVLGESHPDILAIAIGVWVILAALIGGFAFFRRMERSFADVI